MLHLRDSYVLLLLIPALFFVAVSLYRRPQIRVSPLKTLKLSGKSFRVLLWWLPELFAAFSLGLCVLLLAGPLKDLNGEKQNQQGLAIALVIDRSSSMSALIPYNDGRISRLDGVKELTRSFLETRKNDQFALLSFARFPETHSPLSADHKTLESFLDLLHIPESEAEDGTAIGDALVLASARLPKDLDKGKVIIILTDGQNNAGEKTLEEAANLVAETKAVVYAIGLGGDGIIMQDGPAGPRARTIPVNLDEASLKIISQKNGGRYFRVDSLKDLDTVYNTIAQRETARLEKSSPQRSELNLEGGLILLIALSLALNISRYFLLRRLDA